MRRGLTTGKLFISTDSVGAAAACFLDSADYMDANRNNTEGEWNDCRRAVSEISRCSKKSMNMEVGSVFGESRSMGMDNNDCPANGVNLDFTEGLNSHNEAEVRASGSVYASIGRPLRGGDILREERNWKKGKISVKIEMLHVRNCCFDGDMANHVFDVSSSPSYRLINLLPSVQTPEMFSKSSKSIESSEDEAGRRSVVLSAKVSMEKIEGSIREIATPAEEAKDGKLCIRSNTSKLQSNPDGGVENFLVYILDFAIGAVGGINGALVGLFKGETVKDTLDFFNSCVARGI